MPKNALYYLLVTEKENLTLEHADKAEFSHNKEKNKNCCVLSLPLLTEKISDGQTTITLESCHFTIYEADIKDQQTGKVINNNHLTIHATINNQKYTIHIYFNNKDQPIDKPHFSIDGRSNHSKRSQRNPENTAELQEALFDFAKISTQNLLPELRKKQNEKIQKIKKKYQQADREASELSQQLNNTKCKNAYITTLREIKSTAEQLSKLTHYSYYDGAQRIVSSLIKALTSPPTIEKPVINTSNSPSAPTENPVSLIKRKRQKGNKHKKHTPKTAQSNLGNRLARLESTINKPELQKSDIEQYSSLYADIYGLEIGDTIFPTAQLQLFKEYQDKITTIGQTIFFNLIQPELREGNTEPVSKEVKQRLLKLAANLPRLHYLLDAEHLTYALKNGDAKLLEFLLEYGDIDFSNALTYCLENSKMPNREACFDVLIRANAPLTLANKQGIPNAHAILTNPDHKQLRQILIDYLCETGTLSSFYNRLFYSLRMYVNLCQDNEQKSIALKYCLYYKTNVDLFKVPNDLRVLDFKKFSVDIMVLTPVRERVLNYQDITKNLNNFAKLYRDLLIIIYHYEITRCNTLRVKMQESIKAILEDMNEVIDRLQNAQTDSERANIVNEIASDIDIVSKSLTNAFSREEAAPTGGILRSKIERRQRDLTDIGRDTRRMQEIITKMRDNKNTLEDMQELKVIIKRQGLSTSPNNKNSIFKSTYDSEQEIINKVLAEIMAKQKQEEEKTAPTPNPG